MCSIFLTNKPNIKLENINSYMQLRGPDHTQTHNRDDLFFVHNLLSISGIFTPQPFLDGDVTAIFNGEIYNYQDFGKFNSDGECIIPAYRKHGDFFAQHLDGEFAVILVDHKRGQVIFSTDIFATKPLYFCVNGDHFGISSYASALTQSGFTNPIKVPPNSIFYYDIIKKEHEKLGNVYRFSLAQYRDDYDGWINAFDSAVQKRVINCQQNIFIGLSSGYDSGAISCSLNKINKPYFAYSVIGKEDPDVLNQRAALLDQQSKHKFIIPYPEILSSARKYIDLHVEELYYQTYSSQGDYNEFHLKLHDDSGATGLSMVCNEAKKDFCKVYISGQGADEIISDYGFSGTRIYPHSNFGGLFPDDLKTIFPWPSFFGSSQESYLMKEEHVAGAYGIEARYPFLDKNVVQEFLSLSPSLKNANYKSVLFNYLNTNKYPSKFNTKIGF